MASSRDSSNSPDWKDIAEAIHSFQMSEELVVTLHLHAEQGKKGVELCVTAMASALDQSSTALPPLVSASAKCSTIGLKSLEGALLHVLYALDFQLAANAAKQVLD